MKKYYKIAGLSVCIDVFGRLESQGIPYEIKPVENADIHIEPNIEDIKKLFPNLPNDSYLYMATGRDMDRKLLQYDGLRIHASAIVMNQKAYIFSAKSGTGKSTHTSLWRRTFGDEKTRVINDDMPIVRLEKGIWNVYGSPWSGKTGMNLNMRVELGGIAFLERGNTNEIFPCNRLDALTLLLEQSPSIKSNSDRTKMLDLFESIITNVPIWKLKCNMEPEAAIVAYEAMSGQKYEGEWK